MCAAPTSQCAYRESPGDTGRSPATKWPGKDILPAVEQGMDLSFPMLTGWMPERMLLSSSHRCPSKGLSLSTRITYSSIFLEHWDHKCNPDVAYGAIHLGDVAVIGLDLSQSHKLGRPKTLPLDFCKVQSSCGCCMTSPHILYIDPCPLHKKPTTVAMG